MRSKYALWPRDWGRRAILGNKKLTRIPEPAALGFTHRWKPAPNPADADTLLLLHGTDGDENDLLPLGALLLPEANLLSPRGRVLERGMPRFFRRLAEGVFDVPDLIAQTHALAEFVARAADHYGFDPARVTAAGFSNGANIAGGLLLLRPGVLRAAVLLAPMVPLVPDTAPNIVGTRVFIGAGRHDPLVPVAETERLRTMLKSYGADVTTRWEDGGHTLTRAEAQAAADWLGGKK